MNINADKLSQVYVKMREKLYEMQQTHEEQQNALKEKMQIVEAEMLTLCEKTGADSIKTPNGTIMRTTRTRFWTSDFDSLYEFIRQRECFDLLERRVHQGNFKRWVEDNPDDLPKGMNEETRYAVTVRRRK